MAFAPEDEGGVCGHGAPDTPPPLLNLLRWASLTATLLPTAALFLTRAMSGIKLFRIPTNQAVKQLVFQCTGYNKNLVIATQNSTNHRCF